MKLRELALVAYGPFTNASLAFSPRGLHVVYGKNEAGKSTALRAVRGLLFGIDKNTPDAHLHAMKDLRLGATLEDDQGGVLRVVRRKGNANTLLDPATGEPIDEAHLRRMLGGVGEELFARMFGLDHETLRQGAQALLGGKGEIGESLFAASLGSEVHDVLRALTEESEAIFTPQARTRPLNDAIKAFGVAQQKVRGLAESHAIAAQQKGLDDALAEKETCEAERRALFAEKARLLRAQRVRPLVAKRAALGARRAAIGDAPLLPETAAKEREEAVREASTARVEIDRFTREISETEARRAALKVPESLVEREDTVELIQDRLGSHRKAMVDLPRVRGELRGYEDEARGILRRLRRDVSLDDVETLRIDATRQALIRKLAREPARLEEKLRQTERTLAARTPARAELDARLSSPPPPDAGPLQRAASRAQAEGDIEARLRKAEAEAAKHGEQATRRLATLGMPPTMDVATARDLLVPVAETIDRFAEDWSAIDRAEADLRDRASACAEREAQIERDLDALARTSAVPTEDLLAKARARRDEGWELARKAWQARSKTDVRVEAFDPDRPLAEAYEKSVAEADALSDRLRREAERVARLAALEADRNAAARDKSRLDVEAAELRARAADVRAAWNAVWSAVPIDPLPPLEMRAWAQRHAALIASAEQMRASELEAEALRTRIAELRAMLAEALGDPGLAKDDLTTLAATASARARERDDLQRARKEDERAAAALEREVGFAHREREEAAAQLAAWRAAWSREVVAIGIGPAASPEEADTVLGELSELFQRVDEAEKTRRRVAGMDRDAKLFEALVEAAAKEHAPDLVGAPLEQAAAQIVKRYQQGSTALAERKQLDALLVEKRAALSAHHDRLRMAEARLALLCEAARAATLDELEVAERSSGEARAVEAELRKTDAELEGLGWAGEATEPSLDADAIEASLEELEGKLHEIDQHHGVLLRRIGAAEEGLRSIKQESAAAQAATEAQECLAKIRGYVDRYVRVRIAAKVLAREIERYREKHQGPLLARASDLFRRLTLGSFSGLRVGYDDKDRAQLRCVRAATQNDVDVEGLSDGTRDQLYLALRLASLERYAQANPPMPLVVDDILVYFDDDRARAALEALAETAASTQVLLFTHHARVVEIAKGVDPSPKVLLLANAQGALPLASAPS